MRIPIVPHDTLSLTQIKVETSAGERTIETLLDDFIDIDDAEVDVYGIKYRYLDNAHQPVGDWIVVQRPKPKPEKPKDKANLKYREQHESAQSANTEDSRRASE